ncbi:MAG: aspartyl protease family protein [Akkermansia sp.]|nr:aspartyl protease family protein [Akkermansia sp.]MCD8070512.1 aspartyl protease family protein [Akkermansiaceae bacterium]
MNRFFSLIAPLAFALCFSVAASAPGREYPSVEKSEVGGLVVSTLSIDGKPARLIVDTGASHTTLDLEFAGANFPDKKALPVVLLGATNVKTAPKLMKALLECGCSAGGRDTFRRDDYPFYLMDLRELRRMMNDAVDGILGMNTMREAPFRFHAGGAIFSFPEDAEPAPDMFPLRGDPDAGDRLILMARAGGREIPLLLDTGSSVTSVPEDLWEAGKGGMIHCDSTDINGRNRGMAAVGAPMDLEIGENLVLRQVRPLLQPKGGSGILGLDALQDLEILRVPANTPGGRAVWYGRIMTKSPSK